MLTQKKYKKNIISDVTSEERVIRRLPRSFQRVGNIETPYYKATFINSKNIKNREKKNNYLIDFTDITSTWN